MVSKTNVQCFAVDGQLPGTVGGGEKEFWLVAAAGKFCAIIRERGLAYYMHACTGCSCCPEASCAGPHGRLVAASRKTGSLPLAGSTAWMAKRCLAVDCA